MVYKYVGQHLSDPIAEELIIELFTGKTATRQEIFRKVEEAHIERGGKSPEESRTSNPVSNALSDLKNRRNRADNPKRGIWTIFK